MVAVYIRMRLLTEDPGSSPARAAAWYGWRGGEKIHAVHGIHQQNQDEHHEVPNAYTDILNMIICFHSFKLFCKRQSIISISLCRLQPPKFRMFILGVFGGPIIRIRLGLGIISISIVRSSFNAATTYFIDLGGHRWRNAVQFRSCFQPHLRMAFLLQKAGNNTAHDMWNFQHLFANFDLYKFYYCMSLIYLPPNSSRNSWPCNHQS